MSSEIRAYPLIGMGFFILGTELVYTSYYIALS